MLSVTDVLHLRFPRRMVHFVVQEHDKYMGTAYVVHSMPKEYIVGMSYAEDSTGAKFYTCALDKTSRFVIYSIREWSCLQKMQILEVFCSVKEACDYISNNTRSKV